MKQKDKESLNALLDQTKDKYQDLSRRINWNTKDAERLDDLMHSGELQKDVMNRIRQANGSMLLAGIVPSFLAYKAWQRTKAVYSFNREFVEDMILTSDTRLVIRLLDYIPFKDMLFFFPEDVFPKIKEEETAGMFVHIERHSDQLWTMISYYDRKQGDPSQIFPGIHFAFPITNGMKVSEVFETPQYRDCLASYRRVMSFDHQLSDQEADERFLAERKALNAAINLLYYLSAENADIKPIKLKKKPKKHSQSIKEDPSLEVNLHEVGSNYAEIVYRRFKKSARKDEVSDESSEESEAERKGSSKKRRPHARRAHFQIYWTGKGRKIPVNHWISDLFVGTNRDDQSVIVYSVEKEPLKGKENPNTSKKKRDKKAQKK